MKVRLLHNGWFLLAAAALILPCARSAYGEDEIQAFVNPSGRVIFTNAVANPAPVVAAPVITPGIAPVIARMPASTWALVDAVARNHGVDPELVAAVIKVESDFDRWAVSPKGAMGLMQLMPDTGRRFGVLDFFDPRQNIEGGVRYLRFLLDKFEGDVRLSLAAYNAGENLVARLGRIPAITETQNYVRKVLSIYSKESVTMPTVRSVPAAAVGAESAAPESSPIIYRGVDDRGMIYFSNIEPRQ